MIAGRTNGCGVGRDSWCDRPTLGFLSSPLHLAGLLVTVIRGTHISHLHLPSAFSLYISHWTGFEPLLVRFQAVLLVRRCTFLAILTGLCSVLTNNLSPTILCSTESFIRGVADSCRASSFSLGSCFCGPQFLKMSLNGRHAPLILVVFACFFVFHLGLWFLLSWINLDYFWEALWIFSMDDITSSASWTTCCCILHQDVPINLRSLVPQNLFCMSSIEDTNMYHLTAWLSDWSLLLVWLFSLCCRLYKTQKVLFLTVGWHCMVSRLWFVDCCW